MKSAEKVKKKNSQKNSKIQPKMETKMETIRHRQDVLDYLAAENEEQAKRHVYKYSDCGAWIEFTENGIRLGSIVEGCDFGTAIYPLKYPFTSDDYDARMKAIETEAAALWEWANEGGAENGLDAPDVDREYLHLGPEGRSS